MTFDVDKYLARFADLPQPDELLSKQRGVRAVSLTPNLIVKSYQPLGEDAPQYALVGKIVAEWASLEAAIDHRIWALSGAPHNLAACLTAQFLGLASRLNALFALCKEQSVPKAAIDALNDFAQCAGCLAAHRNRIVHDAWSVEDSDEAGARAGQHKLTAQRALNWEFTPRDPEGLARLLRQIRRLRDIFVIELGSKLWEPKDRG